MQLNDKKISKTIIFREFKINAVAYENILKEHGKSQIDMYCFADGNDQCLGSTDNAVKKINLWLGANLPRLKSKT